MSYLKNKTILLISPQSWGDMYISKHHYAIELSMMGNRVYFLNPPDENCLDEIEIRQINPNFPLLFGIEHRINFPYKLKFHAISVFHFLMKSHVKKILKKINNHIDIVWSFDLGNLYPFKLFPKVNLKLFHPVDEPLNNTALNAAKGSDIIFSVTNEILKKYNALSIPSYFINHGLSNSFTIVDPIIKNVSSCIQVGISGNLTRKDIDRNILLKIIRSNPDINFNFWGNYSLTNSNLMAASDNETEEFLKALKVESNVHLHGVVHPVKLSQDFKNIDVFLICYDNIKDQSKGTNYHKVLEMLSSGKVIISNNISTYEGKDNLIEMVTEKQSNIRLPELFQKVINNLIKYNSYELQKERIKFAHDNTYKKQIERIEEILETHKF